MESLPQTHLSNLKQKEPNPSTSKKPSIHLTCEQPIIHLKERQQTKHGSKHIVAITRAYNWHCKTQSKAFKNIHHQMHVHTYTWLTFTYLSATQYLWHHEWACECMFMSSKARNENKTII